MNKIQELHLIIHNLEKILQTENVPAHYSRDMERALRSYRDELNTWLEIKEEKNQSFCEGAYNDDIEKDKEEIYTEWEQYVYQNN